LWLAEELAKRAHYYEAFVLLVSVLREERRLPYFRHFAQDVETFLKELVRLNLRRSVDTETYISCLEAMLTLGFPAKYEATIRRSLVQAAKRK
jgi:hypothetical protein